MIELTEVDGVPAIVAPTSGPTRAGLTFRVGRADETLARSGITHLIEHLALHHLNVSDYHFNGTTGLVSTDFHLEGSESDIARYLGSVCDGLTDLPYHRLETEKEILRTEESSRGSSVLQPFHLWRYGARGYGVVSYPEWGLSMLTPDDVRAWIARFFTRDNAVLWVAGRIPPGLRLRLPGGVRQPVPEPTLALPVTPAFFGGDSNAVALESIVRRSTVVTVFAGVLERELFRALRQEGGLSYTAAATYEPRGDGYASVIALADALPEKQGAVLGGFVDTLAKLRVGRFDPADLTAVIGRSEDVLGRPDADAQRLPGLAVNLLTGHENRPAERLLGEVRAVTVAQLHEVAQEVCANALLMAPAETNGAEWAGFAPAPTSSTEQIIGTRYSTMDNGGAAVVLGPEGISALDRGDIATVRFDECAALLIWPDGGRQLIGNDAIRVRLEPTLVQVPDHERARIDTAVPREAHVVMPARDPRAIPKPRQAGAAGTPATPAPAPTRVKRSAFETVVLVIVAVLAVGFVCLSGLATLVTGTESTADRAAEGGWGGVIILWVLAAVLTLPAIALWRRRRTTRT